METVTCLICGSSNEHAIIRRGYPRHVICRRCGLVYQNPRPSLEEIAAHYESGYWEARPLPVVDSTISPVSAERGRSVVAQAKGLVTPSDLVVEVGCGVGEILDYVRRELGCRAIGIEPSMTQSELGRKRFNLDIRTSDLDAADLGTETAKVIILTHVVEHFHDPVAQLSRCRAMLADDGLLIVEVPNMLNPHPKKRLANWLAFEHIFYYSTATLSVVMARAGFGMTHVECDTFVRMAAKKSKPNEKVDRRNEYWPVRRAIWRHEFRYWPWRVAKKLKIAK